MLTHQYYVYILASRPKGAIYIGVTNDLAQRLWEHKQGTASKHTKRYNIKTLVYYEIFDSIDEAINREKRLKRWRRTWKDELIEKVNPKWKDLKYDAQWMS